MFFQPLTLPRQASKKQTKKVGLSPTFSEFCALKYFAYAVFWIPHVQPVYETIDEPEMYFVERVSLLPSMEITAQDLSREEYI